MSMPLVNDLLLPVLNVAANRVEITTIEMWEKISTEFNLTPDELAEKMKNGTPVVRNRIAWAIVHLELAEILNVVNNGTYRITNRGTSLLATDPKKLTIKVLHELYGVPEKKKRQNSWTAIEEALRNAEVLHMTRI
jgi:restriction endonuclease Mrr